MWCDLLQARPGILFMESCIVNVFVSHYWIFDCICNRTKLKSLSYELREECHVPGWPSHFPHLCQWVFSLILAPLISGIFESSLWLFIHFWQSLPSCEIKASIPEFQCMICPTFINKANEIILLLDHHLTISLHLFCKGNISNILGIACHV